LSNHAVAKRVEVKLPRTGDGKDGFAKRGHLFGMSFHVLIEILCREIGASNLIHALDNFQIKGIKNFWRTFGMADNPYVSDSRTINAMLQCWFTPTSS
jgi:hypothetical protein